MSNNKTTPNHHSEDELGLYEIARCWADETNNPTPNAKLHTLVNAVIDWLSFQKEIEEVYPVNVHLPLDDTGDEAKYLECKEQYRTKRHHFQLKLKKEYTENKIYFLRPNKEPLITDIDNNDGDDLGLYTFLTHLDVNNLTDKQKNHLDQILIGKIIFLRWAHKKTKIFPKFWRKPLPSKYLQSNVKIQDYIYPNYHAPYSGAPAQSEEQAPSASTVKKHDTHDESKPLRWDNSQEAASYYLAHEIWKIYPNIMIGDITGYAGFKEIREAHFDSKRDVEPYATSTTHGHISPAATDLLSRAGTRYKNEEDEERNEPKQSKKQFIELERNEGLKNLYISLIASMKSYRPSDKKTDYPNTKKAKEANSQPLEKEEFIDLRAIFSYIKSESHSRENDIKFFTPCPTYSKKDNKI